MAESAQPNAAGRIVSGLAILLVCQLAGEGLVQLLGVSIEGLLFPGPVLGMAILFAGLLIFPSLLKKPTEPVADSLLTNLSLLFVPAAVGVVQYGPMIAEFGFALIIALVVSTIMTLLVTVGVFIAIQRMTSDGGADDA